MNSFFYLLRLKSYLDSRNVFSCETLRNDFVSKKNSCFKDIANLLSYLNLNELGRRPTTCVWCHLKLKILLHRPSSS